MSSFPSGASLSSFFFFVSLVCLRWFVAVSVDDLIQLRCWSDLYTLAITSCFGRAVIIPSRPSLWRFVELESELLVVGSGEG